MEGTIFGIQHYSVHDGPGIRTLVFLKGCPLRCSWCCNPESQLPQPQIRYIRYRCKQCLACVQACPHNAVALSPEGISPAFSKCRDCQTRDCIDTCNNEAFTVSGKTVSADQIVNTVALDIPFYRNSGGGVTVSGGEPLMQPAFLLEILSKCKKNGIHTAVETCGWATESIIRQILPYTDLFLFDLKVADPELHLHYTGQPLEPVLTNLTILAHSGSSIIIRLPLIPGITDTQLNLEGIAGIMQKNHLKTIHLLPYHTYGEEKYDEHGLVYSMKDREPYTAARLKPVTDFFTAKGLVCTH